MMVNIFFLTLIPRIFDLQVAHAITDDMLHLMTW